ncbi:MAG: sodium:solute symporter, partial [Alloprevotella sp.]|nr:sodium:solute symporter [Alloprevotella sp.]
SVVVAFLLCIVAFCIISNDSIINAIYVLASYTYGPLLGLYAFGLFTRWQVRERWMPACMLLSPVVCGLLDFLSPRLWSYTFGYELLLLNGGLTFILLMLISAKNKA